MIIYWVDSEGGSHINRMSGDYMNWIPAVESQMRLYSFWLGEDE